MNQTKNMTRREVIWGLSSAAACVATGCKGVQPAPRAPLPKFAWAWFAQFVRKMWRANASIDFLDMDETMWREMTDRLVAKGFNVIVWDLGEGMVFPSHPELAVRGSWAPERVRDEISRLRKMGLVSVPKLNFSTTHNQWLGKWCAYITTPEYYNVCSEVIADVANVFSDSPCFHLGYDEETAEFQSKGGFDNIRVRRHDVWWKDFLWTVGEVERHGMRPWIWSDYVWEHPEEFVQRMPKSVIQSNWNYTQEFDFAKIKSPVTRKKLSMFEFLDKHGFDQIPTGSTWTIKPEDWPSRRNFPGIVDLGRKVVSPEHLKGFLMAAWHGPTNLSRRKKINVSIDLAGEVIASYGK